MKIAQLKAIRRDTVLDISICLALALFSGWVITVSLMRPASTREILVALLLLAVAVTVFIHVVRRVKTTLRWYSSVLDTLPLPIVCFDRHMRRSYENKAAADAIGHELYRQNPLFQEIPEGYEIAKRIVSRIGHGENEYLISLSPVMEKGKATGYVAVFYDSPGPGGDSAAMQKDINRLMALFNQISTDFAGSASALARCVKQQAESLYAVAAILNSAFPEGAVEPGELERLNAAILSIHDSIAAGGAHVEEISQVAGNIVDARQTLSKIMKQMQDNS